MPNFEDSFKQGLGKLMVGASAFSFSDAVDNMPHSIALTSDRLSESARMIAYGGDSIAQAGRKDMTTTKDTIGSIASIDLPAGVHEIKPDKHVLGAPKLYQDDTDTRVKFGLANAPASSAVSFNDVNSVLNKPPHALTDDNEFFKVQTLMRPGPWAGDGRGHEISTSTVEINGHKAVMYDYWRREDMAKDSPAARMNDDDLKCRIVYIPNEKTHQVDVLWMQAPVKEFNNRAAQFDKSLHSIEWR
jgi:hypothetical protein